MIRLYTLSTGIVHKVISSFSFSSISLHVLPLALSSFSRYFPPAVARVYIVSFRSNDDRRPSKFIVLAEGRKEAIDMACNVGLEHIKPTPKSLNEILAQVGEEEVNDNGNGVVGIMEALTSNHGSINPPHKHRK